MSLPSKRVGGSGVAASVAGAGGASQSPPPPPRVSARDASQLVCRVLRATLALEADDITPEMMRRCKTMQFAPPLQPAQRRGDDELQYGAVAAAAGQTEADACAGLWKCMHQCVQLQRMQPFDSSSAATAAPPSPPLRDLSLAWSSRSSDSAAREFVAHALRRWHYPLAWRRRGRGGGGGRGQQTAASDSASSWLPYLLRMSARECLLALHWLMGRTQLLQRYISLLATDASQAWFAALPHMRPAVAVRPAPNDASSVASSSKRHANAPQQFPQPVLPPAAWDSAASVAGSGYLEQNDEYRLLLQLLQSNDSASASAASASAMCLPLPAAATAAGSFSLPSFSSGVAVSPVQLHPSYSSQRLAQRVQQCVLLYGRLQERLAKLAQHTAPENARVLVALQQIQRHPALSSKKAGSSGGGGAAGPFTPFELQLLRSPALRSNWQSGARRWLSDLPSSLAPAEVQQALLVWRAWMDSVAALQQQQDDADDNNNNGEQYGDDELAADEAAEDEASTGHASTSFSSARSSRGRPVATQEHAATPPSAARAGRSGAALPPHLRGSAAAAARMPIGHPSASTTTTGAAVNTVAASRIDPSVALWQALTDPLDGFGAAVAIAEEMDNGGDTTSRTLPALLARWQQSVPGSFVPSPSERAVMAAADMHSARSDNDASSYRSSSSSAASAAASSSERGVNGSVGTNSLRWTQAGALEPLLHAQRALLVRLRETSCALVEQAMLDAAEQGRRGAAAAAAPLDVRRGGERFAFTIHT